MDEQFLADIKAGKHLIAFGDISKESIEYAIEQPGKYKIIPNFPEE